MVSNGMGLGGANRRSGREPDQGNEGRGGTRVVERKLRLTKVSRKEIADKVARHQAD